MFAGWEKRYILMDQLHHFFQVRPEDRKIGFASCLPPGSKGFGSHNGLFGNKGRRHTFGFVVIASSHAYHGCFVCMGAIKFLFEVFDEHTYFLADELFLSNLAQGRKLLAARFTASRWHIDLLVPA